MKFVRIDQCSIDIENYRVMPLQRMVGPSRRGTGPGFRRTIRSAHRAIQCYSRYSSPGMSPLFQIPPGSLRAASGKDVYIKRGPGKGWPEECPPIRARQRLGFDLLANFDITFIKKPNGDWDVKARRRHPKRF